MFPSAGVERTKVDAGTCWDVLGRRLQRMAHVILVSDLSHHHSTWTPLAERGREISRVYVYVCICVCVYVYVSRKNGVYMCMCVGCVSKFLTES